MDRISLRQIGLVIALGVLLSMSSKAQADFVESCGGESRGFAFIAATSTLDSWVPYRSEFSEVWDSLGSNLRARGGLVAGLNRRPSQASETFVDSQGSSSAPDPEPLAKLKALGLFESPTADAGMAPTESRPGSEQNLNPQTCLAIPEKLLFVEVFSRVVADSKATPSRPFHLDIFHPPRSFGFSSLA
jgi:hypothetical protein